MDTSSITWNSFSDRQAKKGMDRPIVLKEILSIGFFGISLWDMGSRLFSVRIVLHKKMPLDRVTQRHRISIFRFGNPAVIHHRLQTRGFASPPFGGFAPSSIYFFM
jgi:hypothetical protein